MKPLTLRDVELELANRGELPEEQASISAAIAQRTTAARWLVDGDDPTPEQQAEIEAFEAEFPEAVAIVVHFVGPGNPCPTDCPKPHAHRTQ